MSFENVLLNIFVDQGIIQSNCVLPGEEVLDMVRNGINPCKECERKKKCWEKEKTKIL